MQDDVGFKSQQFAEQVAQRRDRYSQQQIDTSRQMAQLPAQFQGMQHNERRMQMEESMTASRLANDELQRQDAIMQLQWARELHTTDMLAMQREAAQIELDYKRAQTNKMISDLDRQDDVTREYLNMDAVARDNMIENGHFVERSGNRLFMRESTPEEKSGAKARRLERERMRMPQWMRDEESGRSSSGSTSNADLRALIQRYDTMIEETEPDSPDMPELKRKRATLFQRWEQSQGIEGGGIEGEVKRFIDTLIESVSNLK